MKIKPDQNAVTMIQELSDAKAPSGFEDEAVAVAKKYGAEFADVEEDCLRNLYLRSKNNTGNKPVFMLDAHSDEVGLMVHSIKPNGTLRFVSLGGCSYNYLTTSFYDTCRAPECWFHIDSVSCNRYRCNKQGRCC